MQDADVVELSGFDLLSGQGGRAHNRAEGEGQPAMTEGTSPDDHYFKEICCLGVTVPLQGLQVTGSWTIDGNMDLQAAKMLHPISPCLARSLRTLPFSLENTHDLEEAASDSPGLDVGNTQQPEKEALTPAGSKTALLLPPTPADKEPGSILAQSSADCKKRKVDEGAAVQVGSLRVQAAELTVLNIAAGGTMEFGYDVNALSQTSGYEPNAQSSSLFPEQRRSPFAPA
eukprot:6432027-Amphidinium_carterae.1